MNQAITSYLTLPTARNLARGAHKHERLARRVVAWRLAG